MMRKLGLGLVVAVVAALLALAFSGDARSIAMISGGAFITIALVSAAAIALRRGRRDLFSPPALALPYLCLGMGIHGIGTLFGGPSEIAAAVDTTAADYPEILWRAYLLAGIALIAFGIVYQKMTRGHGRKMKIRALDLSSTAETILIVCGWVIALPGAAALFSRLGMDAFLSPGRVAVEGTVGLFWAFPLLAAPIYASLLVIGNRWSAGRSAPPIALASLVASSLFAFLLTSSKAMLFGTVIMVLFVRHRTVGAVKLRTIIIVLLIAILSLPLLYAYRAFGLNSEALVLMDTATMASGFEIVMGRSYTADSFMATMLYTPRVYPYQFGKPWLELFYFWIPRAIWPDKPLSQSLSFGQTYLAGSKQAGASYFSVSMLGDGYLNFGPVGVILLFSFVGFVMGWIYRRWGLESRTCIGVILYASCVYPITISTEQSLSVFLTQILPHAFVAGLVGSIAGALVRQLRIRKQTEEITA